METRKSGCERFSCRALRTLAAFGLTVEDLGLDAHAAARMRARSLRLADRVMGVLPEGGIAAILGPSGAGKSTVLRAIGRSIAGAGGGARAVSVEDGQSLARSRRRAIDLVAGSCGRDGRADHERAMRLLAGAGMADVRLAVMRACDLSDGERARLALAIAMGACGESRGAVLLADELGSRLDDQTAASVAAGLARWVSQRHARAVVVTHSAETLASLRPRVVVRLRAGWLDTAARTR